MKIALITQGRFHALDLMGGLLARGHDVVLMSGHPESALRRAGIPGGTVRTYGLHGVSAHAIRTLGWPALERGAEAPLHQAFGRWAARELERDSWDVVYAWSSAAEESLRLPHPAGQVRVVERGSSHIVTQRRLLDEEAARVGTAIERPSDWMVAREQREYALADAVAVLSTFARQSFIDQGVDPARVWLLRPGVDVEEFRPSDEVLARRIERIRSGDQLRVLFVGTLSFRKGLWDLATMMRRLGSRRMDFTLVGDVPVEAREIVADLSRQARVEPRQPRHRLRDVFGEADVFVFPTIEDGFGLVLAQAHAAGLPILTTPNGGGLDVIADGRTGWILPVRMPDAFAERLQWCDEHREEFARLVECAVGSPRPRGWTSMAEDLETAVHHAQTARGRTERGARGA